MTHKVKKHKDMVEFTTGDGVRRLKSSRSFGHSKCHGRENGVVTIKTYEDFTVHYTDAIRFTKPPSTRPTPWKSRLQRLCNYGYCRNKRIIGDSPWKQDFQINFVLAIALLTLTACSQSQSTSSKSSAKKKLNKRKPSLPKKDSSAKDTSKTGKKSRQKLVSQMWRVDSQLSFIMDLL